MTHKLKVRLAPSIPEDPGIVAAHTKPVREQVLRWLFGAQHPITILVPGKTVQQIDIQQEVKQPEDEALERLASAVMANAEGK